MSDSPAIAAAKAKADATDYVRKYGPDESYWTHFLNWKDSTSADWRVAIELIERVSPEADHFLHHLREMERIAKMSEPEPTSTPLATEMVILQCALYESTPSASWDASRDSAMRMREILLDHCNGDETLTCRAMAATSRAIRDYVPA